MSLHALEAVAGELIALVLGGLALAWVWKQHKKQEPPPGWPGRGETTEYSSTQDD